MRLLGCMTAPCSQMSSTIAARRATKEVHEVAKANQIIAMSDTKTMSHINSYLFIT
jgi:hypothetical protein